MSTSLDASMFSFGEGFHAMYLQEAMSMLSSAYEKVVSNLKYDTDYNENKLRDDLVKFLPAKRKGFAMTLDTESRNLDKENVRIDITIITLEVLTLAEDDFEKRITVECKIIGVDQYINRNGIISFVEGKYASQLPVAGMIGFVLKDTPENIKDQINAKLKTHISIKTTNYLQYELLENKFKNSYKSTHSRIHSLPTIDIHHLLLDYSTLVTKKKSSK